MARQNQNGSERRRVASVLIVVGVALLLFSGWVKMRNTVVAIRTEKAAKQDIVSLISTNGKIEPVSNFEAHAPAPATVKRVLVHEGDHVKAGQLLLELDNADALAQKAKAYAQLRSAEADLLAVKGGGTNEEVLTTRADLSKATAEQQEAQRNFQAVQKLAQNGAASPAEVQAAEDRVKKADADVQLLQSKLSGRYSTPEIARAEANVTQARAAYAATQELINNAIVHSPFDGTVYQLPVKQGSYVPGGQLLIQVAKLETVQVRGFIDEPEIGRLAKGQKVEIRWDAIPGRVWEGSLTRLPTVVTMVGTRTVGEITCTIDNFDRKLLPNVNVNVSIVVARHPDALTVSREAVHDVEGKRYVYRIVDHKIQSQEVQTGLASLTRVEITKGLSEGTEVALGALNAQPLRTGMEVKVVER